MKFMDWTRANINFRILTMKVSLSLLWGSVWLNVDSASPSHQKLRLHSKVNISRHINTHREKGLLATASMFSMHINKIYLANYNDILLTFLSFKIDRIMF